MVLQELRSTETTAPHLLPGRLGYERQDTADRGVECEAYVRELRHRGYWREYRDAAVALNHSLWRVRGFVA